MKYSRALAISTLLFVVGCTPAGPRPELRPPEPRAESGRETVSEPAESKPRRPTAPVILGVITSQSGDPFLERFGSQVVDGIRLAVDEHNRSTGRPVELVILDDGGDPARAAELVAQLEARRAVAIVGPLRPEGVAAVAAAQRDTSLVLVSPTASELPRGKNLYSLNTVDTRGAEAMAAYALREGLRRVGLLYPESPEYRRQAEVFRDHLVRGGGAIISEVTYAQGTTTFAMQLQTLAEAAPDAVFIPVPERDARQIAPQITYYGLAETGARILGGEGWSGDAVLDGVPARYLEGIVATAAFYRASPEFGWNDFVALYEETYRRSVDNPLPALGFDAARLILRALGEGEATAAEVRRRFEEQDELRGATGWISVRNGMVGRRPILVRIEDGKLVPLSGTTGH